MPWLTVLAMVWPVARGFGRCAFQIKGPPLCSLFLKILKGILFNNPFFVEKAHYGLAGSNSIPIPLHIYQFQPRLYRALVLWDT